MKKTLILILIINSLPLFGQGLLINPSNNQFFLKSDSDVLGSIERSGSTSGFLNFYYGGSPTGIDNPTGNHIGSIGFSANSFIISSHGSVAVPENILFRTNNTDRLLISHTGNVRIGTASAAAKLNVFGDVVISKKTVLLSSTTTYNNLNRGGASIISTGFSGTPIVITITGITDGEDGMLLYIFPTAFHTINLSNENITSTAANRITTPDGSTYTLAGRGGVTLIYSSADSRWHVIDK